MGFSLITRKPPSVIRVGNKISFSEYREEACANCRGWEWNGSEVGRTEKPALRHCSGEPLPPHTSCKPAHELVITTGVTTS